MEDMEQMKRYDKEAVEYINTQYIGKRGNDFNSFIFDIGEELDSQVGKHVTPMARSITVQLTDACNLCCSYCYQINKGNNVLSLENGKKFIDLLLTDDKSINNYLNRYNSDIVILDFIGGEPLLEIDLMVNIVDYFVKRMIELDHPWLPYYKISVGTNGVLYFDKRFQKFLRKYREKVSVNITVDGNKKLHDSCRIFHNGCGSYDMAIAAVSAWKEFSNQEAVGTKLTIAPENVEFLSEAILHMIDLGFIIINENPVYEKGWELHHATTLYHQLKIVADYLLDNDLEFDICIRMLHPETYVPMEPGNNSNWCGGDGKMLAVDVHGNLFNCIRYMESSLGTDIEPLVIGNVNTGIGSAKKEKCNIQCMQCITRRSQSTDECFNCQIAQGCGWCSAYNYQEFGTCNKRATYICEMHKAASLVNCYFWNRVLIKHQGEETSIKHARIEVRCPEKDALRIIGEDEYKMVCDLAKITEV